MGIATAFLLMPALVLGACGGDGRVADETTAPTTTTTLSPTTTKTTSAPPPTSTTTTTTSVVSQVVLATDGTVTVGEANGETVFRITHGVASFADLEMTPGPNGTMETLGLRGGMWVTVDDVRHQAEINRLWPPDQAIDVIWLTSNRRSADFELFDALTLEGELGRFGLHADCRTPAGDVGAALLSFDGATPVPLIAWGVDRETMTFVELDVVEGIEVGDCMTVEPRG